MYIFLIFLRWNLVIDYYKWKKWEKLSSLGEIFTDVSQMNHVKTTKQVQINHAKDM